METFFFFKLPSIQQQGPEGEAVVKFDVLLLHSKQKQTQQISITELSLIQVALYSQGAERLCVQQAAVNNRFL